MGKANRAKLAENQKPPAEGMAALSLSRTQSAEQTKAPSLNRVQSSDSQSLVIDEGEPSIETKKSLDERREKLQKPTVQLPLSEKRGKNVKA